MSTHTPGYNGYQTTAVKASLANASPLQMVIMLTDALLDELERLRGHIDGKRFERKASSVWKCLTALTGLEAALDDESQSEMTECVAQMYQYCRARVSQAGVEMSTAPLDEVRLLLGALRDAWQQAHDEGR